MGGYPGVIAGSGAGVGMNCMGMYELYPGKYDGGGETYCGGGTYCGEGYVAGGGDVKNGGGPTGGFV